MQRPEVLSYFQAVLRAAEQEGVACDARLAANWVVGELVGAARAAGGAAARSGGIAGGVSPQRLAQLLGRVSARSISGTMAKDVLAAMTRGDSRPVGDIVAEACCFPLHSSCAAAAVP